MKSFIFIVLVSFGVIATVAGSAVDTTPTPNVSLLLKTLKSTSNVNADTTIINTFLMNCPDAGLHQTLCLLENNFNPDPVTDVEECAMSHLILDCTGRAIAANTPCAGAQEASAAVQRLRAGVIEVCADVGSAAASLVAGFFAVIVMTCLHLIK